MTPELEKIIEKMHRLSAEEQNNIANRINALFEEKDKESRAKEYTQEKQMKIETGLYQSRQGDLVQEELWDDFLDKCTGVL